MSNTVGAEQRDANAGQLTETMGIEQDVHCTSWPTISICDSAQKRHDLGCAATQAAANVLLRGDFRLSIRLLVSFASFTGEFLCCDCFQIWGRRQMKGMIFLWPLTLFTFFAGLRELLTSGTACVRTQEAVRSSPRLAARLRGCGDSARSTSDLMMSTWSP